MRALRCPSLPFVTAASLVVLLLVAALSAEARPGGGQSYSGSRSGGSSGGSSSSSSSSSASRSSSSSSSTSSTSGGGGSGEMSPVLGISLFIVMFGVLPAGLIVVAWKLDMIGPRRTWSSQTVRSASPPPLGKLRETDPDFSLVLFEDFANALFARAHGARHSEAELAGLSPYLELGARALLRARPPVGAPVRAAVVGSMRVAHEHFDTVRVKVGLVFEANLVVAAPGGDVTHYVRERWYLSRPLSARTRPWKGVRTFGCPACGAPLETGASNACASCGQAVNDGKFDWKVSAIAVEALEERPPSLTGTVEERGTELPTVVTPGREALRDALLSDDPSFTLSALEDRLRLIFEELQKSWAAQDLSGVRPYVSAGLCQYLDYWVTAYRAQGLRNEVDGATLSKSELVRVVRDACYDSLTLRIWGSGRDFTVRVATGEIVAGSRKKDRKYTEYWTLIRGAKVRGAPRADRSCPACGAAVKVGMEGNCAYCGALVTAGDFDWVLSRIEQDDSYAG